MSVTDGAADRSGKANRRNPGMHVDVKSDGSSVPAKQPNRAEGMVAEAVEGKGPIKGNMGKQNASRTESRIDAPSALARVRKVKKADQKNKVHGAPALCGPRSASRGVLTSNKHAAAGVEGVTWQHYGEQPEENLPAVHARVHRGAYRAKPSRRVYIPKPDGGSPSNVPYDAKLLLSHCRERLARFRLELHPDKPRLLRFGRFAAQRKEKGESGAPQTFNFFGFTLCCIRSKSGLFLLLRHQMRSRLTAKVHEITLEMRRRLHEPIVSQGQWLGAVLRGHYG